MISLKTQMLKSNLESLQVIKFMPPLVVARDCKYPEILIPGYQVLKWPNTRVSGTGNGYLKIAWLLQIINCKNQKPALHILSPSSGAYSLHENKLQIGNVSDITFSCPRKYYHMSQVL